LSSGFLRLLSSVERSKNAAGHAKQTVGRKTYVWVAKSLRAVRG
jgi:hypothetical protein